MELITKTRKYNLFVSNLILIGLICSCLFHLISCKDQTNPTLTSNIVFPSSGVSFSKHVESLFMQTCVAAGCHSINLPAANLNLENDVWHSLIDYVPPIVIVKNGNDSPLVKYLDGRLAPQMPLRQPPLTTNQINGIKTWINEGAQNN